MAFLPDTAVLLHRVFHDFDELGVAARLWNLELMQLDRGRFEGEVFQALAGGILLSEARFGRVVKQLGVAPRGVRTFAVPAASAMHFKWRCQNVGPNDLLLFPPSGELHAVSDPDFHVFTISLPEETLREAAETLELKEFPAMLRCERIRCPGAIMGRLREKLHRCVRAAKADLRLLGHRAALDQLRAEIPRVLVEAMTAPGAYAWATAPRKRDRAVKRAEAYIAEHQDEPLTVGDLCLAAQASERTLQYGFLEHFGITPKAYLKAVRLNGVHREFKSVRSPDAKINEVAAWWGFWHMGQFAADYRKHFGELPSQTLLKSNGVR